MSANELDNQLHSLTPARRATVLQTLTQTLVNAWAYAEAYPEEIEAAIQQNEAFQN